MEYSTFNEAWGRDGFSLMRFTDTSLGITESIFKPLCWSCVKHHEISTNTFPIFQCTFNCGKWRPAWRSSKNTMGKFILVVKSKTEWKAWLTEDSVKVFLLKAPHKFKRGNWETQFRKATGISSNSACSHQDEDGHSHSEGSAKYSVFQCTL